MTTNTPDTAAGILLVTGPSGAGRSTAVNALEDLGFEVIDNLPLSLLPKLMDGPALRPLALGLDVRNRDFGAAALIEAIDRMTETHGDAVQVLFLDAEDDVLVRRYSETRRRHPLAPAGPPLAGIQHEKELLVPIRARADFLIDTSALTVHETRAEMDRLCHVPDHGLAGDPQRGQNHRQRQPPDPPGHVGGVSGRAGGDPGQPKGDPVLYGHAARVL